MAKVGYLFKANHYDGYETDVQWMQQYGCVQILTDEAEDEAMRPIWKKLLTSLACKDELVIAKFSNAVRNTMELASIVEICRVKKVRLISINDEIDSADILFPTTTVSDVLNMFGSLSDEVAALRNASAHVCNLQKNILKPVKQTNDAVQKHERDKIILEMYRNNHNIESIMEVSGFTSRSSVFRILNKYGVKPNRGRGPGRKKHTDDSGSK